MVMRMTTMMMMRMMRMMMMMRMMRMTTVMMMRRRIMKKKKRGIYAMNSAVAVSLSLYFTVLIIFRVIVLSLVLLPGRSYKSV